MKKLLFVVALILLIVALAACGGESSPSGGDEGAAAGPGDAGAGKKIFEQTLIGTQAGCITCHSLEPGVTMVGPSLATIGTDAGSRVAGMSAEEYIRQSILEPDAYIVEGFSAGVMPIALADELTDQQVNDLVVYLLTLK